MSSIKSLATLMILAVVSGYLYLKITETEPVLPPEAADLSYDVPQIDLDSGGGESGLSPPQGLAGGPTAFGPSSDASEAPPYDPSLADSAPPAWPGTTGAPQAVADPSGTAPTTTPPPITLPSDTPPGMAGNGPPANPFDRSQGTPPPAARSLAVGTSGDVTPNSNAAPPPGAMGISQDTVIQGRVYDAAATGASVPPPETNAINPSPYASVAPGPPAAAVPTGVDLPTRPAATSSVQTALQSVELLLAQSQYSEALRILTGYYRDPSLTPHEQEQVDQLLGQLAGTVIYSTEHRLGPPHRVAVGETLSSIADRCQVPAELLAKINGVADRQGVAPGTELKIIRGPFMATVDLTRRELTLLLDGRYAGRFPIHVSTDQPPVEGDWVVATKEIDPEYVGPQQLIAGGDPSNPFGHQLLVLGSSSGEASGFGIHGSPLHGETDSRGSIRLSSADAADVFDILSVGSKVVVRR